MSCGKREHRDLVARKARRRLVVAHGVSSRRSNSTLRRSPWRVIHERAIERGDIAVPGLDRNALSKHENGHKRPGPYYRTLYCEVYGATPAALGFRLALPGETSDHDDVDRREFLAGAAGLAANLALPAPPGPARRIGDADLVHLRESVENLYTMGHQHGGAGAVYPLTVRTLQRLRDLAERARYDDETGRGMRELIAHTAANAGNLAFDAGQHNDARRWWGEAMHWARLAEADAFAALVMAALARQTSGQHRPRETINLARAAQQTAGRAATPRLTSLLLAREALGHAGARDAGSAHVVLRDARGLVAKPRPDEDPVWLAFYGPADFTSHECRIALMLGDDAAAETAARDGLALSDPVAFPRNYALDLVNLAAVLAQRRQFDESAALASQAAAAVAHLDSRRVTRGLHSVARRLAPFKDDPGVGPHLDAIHAALPTSTIA
jgi:hypothetical protein